VAHRGFAQSARTLATIAALYEAALNYRLWPVALDQLTRLTGSQASTFWALDAASRTLHPTFVSINFDQRAVDDYVGGMAALDPTVRYLLSHPEAGIVHDDLLGPGDDEKTRQYLDWHERSVETRYRLVAQSDLGSGLQAGVALHRARNAGRFDASDLRQFDIINEHLRRALAIGAKLASLTAQQQLTADFLDRNVSAVILLDARRRVVFMNRAAEALNAQADGIRVSPDGIGLALRSEDERLQGLIAGVMTAQRSRLSVGDVMPASRPSGRTSYRIWATGMTQLPAALSVFRPAVCLLIQDPQRPVGPALPHLQALFQMTPAEARLAIRLAEGETLRAAAEALGITYGTARSRLTQLFRKTNTQSQGQLIRVLLTCGPAVTNT
jgi:DNA-binding CsgD family transcriptional regulator